MNVMPGIKGNEHACKKYLNEKIVYVGKKFWINCCDKIDRVQEHVSKKRYHMNDMVMVV